MLRALHIQLRILIAHGALSFCLGAALLYLSAAMTNRLFEAIAVVLAILMASAALIMGALADWVAAWGEGTKHLQRSAFYLLSGLAFATAGAYLGIYAPISLEWLILVAAIHALAFGLLGIAVAVRAKHHGWVAWAVFAFGAVSVVFSAAMAELARQFANREATMVLGLYFCFVGIKLRFLAWDLNRRIATGELVASRERGHARLITLSSPTNAVKQ